MKIYESRDDVYVFIEDHEDNVRQKIHRLLKRESIKINVPTKSKVSEYIDKYMQPLGGQLVYSGNLNPGNTTFHRKSKGLGIEYFLRPYRQTNRSGTIDVEYVEYNEVVAKTKEAIFKRDEKMLPPGRLTGVSYFISDFVDRSVDLTTSLDELKAFQNVVSRIGIQDKGLSCFVMRRKMEIELVDLSLSAKDQNDLNQLDTARKQFVPGCYVPTNNKVSVFDPFQGDGNRGYLEDRQVVRAFRPEEASNYAIPANSFREMEKKLQSTHYLISDPGSETESGRFVIGAVRKSDLLPMKPRGIEDGAMSASVQKVNKLLSEAEAQARSDKISSLRSQNSFRGYWDAYLMARDPVDIKSAYMKANSDQEKSLAEKGIVLALPLSRIFDVKIANRVDSSLRTGKSSGLFQSAKVQMKDINRKVVISVRKDIPFAIKYADYQITLKFKEMLNYEPPVKGKDEDFLEKSLTFDLGKKNSWKNEQELVFEGIPVSGTVRPGGVKALGFMMGLLGGKKLKEGDLDIHFKLKGSDLKYDMEGLK